MSFSKERANSLNKPKTDTKKTMSTSSGRTTPQGFTTKVMNTTSGGNVTKMTTNSSSRRS